MDPNANADRLKDHRWKPGQSGNPAGRPPGQGMTDILNRLLDRMVKMKDPFDDGKMRKTTIKERIALAMIIKAMKGGERAAEFIADRTDGKVPQPMKLSGSIGGSAPQIPKVDFSGIKTKDLERALAALVAKHADQKKRLPTD